MAIRRGQRTHRSGPGISHRRHLPVARACLPIVCVPSFPCRHSCFRVKSLPLLMLFHRFAARNGDGAKWKTSPDIALAPAMISHSFADRPVAFFECTWKLAVIIHQNSKFIPLARLSGKQFALPRNRCHRFSEPFLWPALRQHQQALGHYTPSLWTPVAS